MIPHNLNYYLLRAAGFFLGHLKLTTLHSIGKVIGSLAYLFLKKFRKKTLSNLALAKTLQLSHQEIIACAKLSFHNLAINLLDYFLFAKAITFQNLISCSNPSAAYAIHKKNQGIIFFCGHLSNWETLFLDGTSNMKGVAIGRPIKNKKLYAYITQIRQKMGGIMLNPKNALKDSLKYLKKGYFLGIVGDQAFPESNYSYRFLGRRMYLSNAPALLAYKTNSPIIVATAKREKNRYLITYSDPIFPNLQNSLESEIDRLMNCALKLFETAIVNNKSEWLWQHNCYKQQSLKEIYKCFRQDAILIILPQNLETIQQIISTMQKIYANEFLFLLCPQNYSFLKFENFEEIYYYSSEKQKLLTDFRFKLVFDFTDSNMVSKHYLSLAAFSVFNTKKLKKIAKKNNKSVNLKAISEILTSSILRNPNRAL